MKLNRQSTFLLLAYLAAISFFVAQAPITFEKSPSIITGTINFQSTSGTATPIGKGKGSGGSSASLTLTGSFSTQGNGKIKLSGLTGTLTIGTTSYSLTGGYGVISGKGMVEIHVTAMAPASQPYGYGQLQLILHGTSTYTPTEGTITFTAPQSKLSSLYFLSITGQETRSP